LPDNRFVIFTDLDGSLLDHGDYSFSGALPMLKYLRTRKIPLIYTTSKTRQECLALQKAMGICAPFIVENGACVCFPDGEGILLGRPHEEIAAFIDRYKVRFGIRAFKDMPVEEIARHADVSNKQAALAKEREFSEPFLIDPEMDIDGLREKAKAEGFSILRGGRFYHCVGARQDKGAAVRKAIERYPGYLSIGLGDNFNDIALLESVDVPILIPRHGGDFIPFEREGLRRAPCEGSRGWNAALKAFFDAYER